MPSDKKKNPALGPLTEAFSEEYISTMSYLIEYRGFMSLPFCSDPIKETQKISNRQVFDTYPIYLKHTLFHDDENMKKVRDLEVSQRFFIYDKYREKGNKLFQKL